MAIRSNQQNGSSGLPVGLRFHPTDQELLDYFLRTRIAVGDNFHSDFVADCPHFYGDQEPWVFWQNYGGGESKKVEDEKSLYFFTHRRRLSRTAKRFDRKVGSGTWSGQYCREVEDDDGVVIGLRRDFRYEGGSDCRHNDAWLMQEFQLIDTDSDSVLCTLRKNPRKAPPTPTAVVENKKRKTIVEEDQPRKPKSNSKKQKKEGTCHQEQQQGSTTVHPNYELPCPQMDDLDFNFAEIYPELFVEGERDLFTMDELLLLGPTPTWEKEGNNDLFTMDELETPAWEQGNNFNLVTGNMRPINVVCWKRAICLEFMDKADVLEYYDQTVNSPSGSFYIPAVLRIPHLLQVVKRRRIKCNLSRKNILCRDCFTCQYCSSRENLTIDHVIPIARGGEWKWENLVTACAKCNSKKGQKTLEEACMKLMKIPKTPKDYDILAITLTSAAVKMLKMRKGTPEEWLQYLSKPSSMP